MAQRPCGHLFANIFSCRFSGHAPNPLQVKMQAAWQRCSALTKTSMNCWKISVDHFTACARAESTKNCLKSSPALKRCPNLTILAAENNKAQDFFRQSGKNGRDSAGFTGKYLAVVA